MAARYYAKGAGVYQRPLERTREDGTKAHTMGFLVAKVDQYVLDPFEAAKQIANAMNLMSAMEESLEPEIKLLKDIMGDGIESAHDPAVREKCLQAVAEALGVPSHDEFAKVISTQ